MSDNLIIKHLQDIRADLANLTSQVSSLSVQVSAMGQQMSGLTTAVYSHRSDSDDLRARIERIERRLELTE